MTLHLFDGAGEPVITGSLHSLGDADRAARQHRVRRGHVEDERGRVVGRIERGVMVGAKQEEGRDVPRKSALE